MPKKGSTGKYYGGYLNKQEIANHLDEIFNSGTVPNPENQIQQSGIDLTLKEVRRLDGGPVPFLGSDEWCHLPRGHYVVYFNEVPTGSAYFGFLIWSRSTLFRIGGTLDCGCGKLPLAYDMLWGRLEIANPFGLRLQKGARIAQTLINSSIVPFREPHPRLARSEPMTVGEVFAYRSEGILGIEDRKVETERIERATLAQGEGFLVRYKEVVRIAPDEVVYSLGDNPHREIQSGWGGIKSQLTPYSFLMAGGAIADAGYVGQLSTCVTSGLPVLIYEGVPLLRLEKHRITSVDEENLYRGKYHATGVESEEADETVVWLDPMSA